MLASQNMGIKDLGQRKIKNDVENIICLFTFIITGGAGQNRARRARRARPGATSVATDPLAL